MVDITVIKRDGSEEDFNVEKISNSIMGAAMAVGGEDFDLADEIAGEVADLIASNGITVISSADIQNIVEKTLIEDGHAATAKEYILKGADRSRIREMDSSLMRSFEEITFTSPEGSETKRENANIDSSTAMGTMLKYGSEGAKSFNLMYLMSNDIAEAHKNGDIHIHDLDFLSLTETCVSGDTCVAVRIDGNEQLLKAEDLFKILGGREVDKVIDLTDKDVHVISNGKYVKVKNIVAHSAVDKQMLRVKAKTGYIDVTSDHRVSVLRNGRVLDVHAKDLVIGDILDIPEIDPGRFGGNFIDLIDIYQGDNLIIANTKDVLNNIKALGNWDDLCKIFDYSVGRYSDIRYGHKHMLISEYKMIEHLSSLKHSNLKLSYKRTRGEESIDAVLPLTYELGRFIGFMYAEGSITIHECTNQESPAKVACFCNYDAEMIDDFKNCLMSIFNNPSFRDRKHQGMLTGVHLSGYLTYELFSGLFGTKHSTDNIRLADWMFSANKDFVSGLMSGLIDGDGYIQKDGYRVGLASISLGMLSDIQKLLLMRGIESTIVENGSAKAGSDARFINDGVEVTCKRNYNNFRLETTGKLKDKFSWVNSFKVNERELKNSDKYPYKYREIVEISNIDYSGCVYDMETEDHHFTANGFNVHNCCQIPLDSLFENGFNTGHGFLREPGNIRTASALAAIAIQSNQNDQHGGQSIPLFDYYLAPYVAKTYVKVLAELAKVKFDLTDEQHKELKDIMVDYWKNAKGNLVMSPESIRVIKSMVEEFLEDKCVDFSERRIQRLLDDTYEKTYSETFQAMEAFIHNLNTMHSRAGAQVPFSSINYGTDTSVEGRMVIETILRTTYDGLGNGEIPIFPVQIMKIKEGVNFNPGDPNYDLYKLSCKVWAKRLYPNWVNLDATFNAELYVEGRPETEMATMGCVESSETVDIRINGIEYANCKISDAFDIVEKLELERHTEGRGEYIKTKDIDVAVYDSSRHGYVKVLGIIRNKNIGKEEWVTITFNNGLKLHATLDHPLPIEGKGRTFVKDVVIGDKVRLSDKYDSTDRVAEIVSMEIGLPDGKVSEFSYDVETESDRFDVSFLCSHNCRTRVGKNIYDPNNSILPGRGNLSFTSINLPRLGILAKGDINKFYKLLDNRLELVHRQLLERFELQCLKHPINYPFLMGQGVWLGSDRLGPNDDIRSVLKHGSLTVGFIGLAETLVALTGKHHGESEESQKLGLEIVQHMRDYTDKWSEEEKMNYTLIGTPAEGLSGRFVRIDAKRFGKIPGVTDRDYYTNSSHVPVYYPITAYRKIEIEAPYHEIENGGHILYIEVDGDPSKNIKGIMKLIKYMHDNNVGYMACNHQLDRDPVCRYVGIINDVCPRCGRKEGEPMTMEMWRKIHGYANAGNFETLGYRGNVNEEMDRMPNPVDGDNKK